MRKTDSLGINYFLTRRQSLEIRVKQISLGTLLIVLLPGVMAFLFTWRLWVHPAGILAFVDYNLPTSGAALNTSIREALSPWNSQVGLGSINVGFLGTYVFLILFKLLSIILPMSLASRMLLVMLIWLDSLGMAWVLRRELKLSVLACLVGSLFYVYNPWTFDEINQGHLYTIEVLTVLPIVFVSLPRWPVIDSRKFVLLSLLVAAVLGFDYHLGVLALMFFGLEVISSLFRRQLKRAALLVLVVILGLMLLGYFLGPYWIGRSALQQSNSPSLQDFLYFTHYVSPMTTLTMLRPGMNAATILSYFPSPVVTIWIIMAIGVALTCWLSILFATRYSSSRSITLPLAAVFVMLVLVLSSSPVSWLAKWAYANLPLATIYRDPSQLLVVPLILYAFSIARLSDGCSGIAVSGMSRAFNFFSRKVVRGATAVEQTRIKAICLYIVSGTAVLLIAPFMAAGLVNNAVVPQVTTPGVLSKITSGGRVAYLPPWEFVYFPNQTVAVTDPYQIYPVGASVPITPNYDNGPANEFVRWMYLDLYYDNTRNFFNILRLAGVNVLVARPYVVADTGMSSPIQHALSFPFMKAALGIQRLDGVEVVRNRNQTYYAIQQSGEFSSVRSFIQLDTTDRDIINSLSSLGNLSNVGLCVIGQCPSSASGLQVSELGDSIDFSAGHIIPLNLGTIDEFSPGAGWINGTLAFDQDFGSIAAQIDPVAYAQRHASGVATAVGLVPLHQYYLSIQVLRGPTRVRYSVRCGKGYDWVLRPSASIGPFSWLSQQLGPISSSLSSLTCRVSFVGKEGAISGLSLVPRSSIVNLRPRSIVFAPGSDASSWQRSLPGGWRRGVPFESIVVNAGGRASYVGFPGNMLGTVYAEVTAEQPGSSISVLGAKSSIQVGKSDSDWIRLGSIVTGLEGRVVLTVPKGSVAIENLAVVPGRVNFQHPLSWSANYKATFVRSLSLRGNAAVFRVYDRNGNSGSYLVVREVSGGVWTGNGKTASGIYIGYGQIYPWKRHEVVLVSEVGKAANAGLVVSLFGLVVIVAVLFSGSVWRRRRRRG